MRQLVTIRKAPEQADEHNGVDVLLDDVFQLLSLAFLTVGITNKAPATYASLSTVKKLLDHLHLSSTYTEADVQPVRERLNTIGSIVDRAENDENESPEILELMRQKLSLCYAQLQSVEDNVKQVPPELAATLQRLVYIKREIMSIGSRPKYSQAALKPLQEELRKIDAQRVDGKFMDATGKPYPEGQSVVNAVLERCHELIDDFSAHEDNVDEALKPLYTELVDMKNRLEGLLITHRWTLRETDLYNYQRRLQEIDDLRSASGFKVPDDKDAGIASRGQAIVLYLIRRCYAMIYKLLESSEPVSEALAPIHNQLQTTRRCLLEVKKMGGLSSIRELYPYQMKLASIDDLRKDGKFMVGDYIPEGQGMLNALLAECFDICYELKVEMEESNSTVDNSEANSAAGSAEATPATYSPPGSTSDLADSPAQA